MFRNKKIKLIVSNVAEGTHAGNVTFLLEEATEKPYLLAEFGTAAGKIKIAGGKVAPVGIITASADEQELVNLGLLGCAQSTYKMIASTAIPAGAAVYAAAKGEVCGLPGAAGTYFMVGRALTASTAAGQIIEVDPCVATPVDRK